jgi:hypothetical protein
LPEAAVEQASTEIPTSTSAVPALAAASTSGTAPDGAPAGDRLRVSLSAIRECWVSVAVDGEKSFESLLRAGDQRTIEAQREIVLTAGDASALAIRINGAEARPLGGRGEVVTTRLSLTNFKEYLSNQ